MLEEKKRNVGIELFRILMMLGIVATHICWQREFASPWLGRLSETCVVGFAMISGYFWIRFAPSKLIRLYALAIGYCFIVPIVGGVMPWGGGRGEMGWSFKTLCVWAWIGARRVGNGRKEGRWIGR